MSYSSTSSTFNVQHPVPTHLAFIPEPPSMPVSPQDYQHFISSLPLNQQYATRTQYHPPFPLILSPQLQHIPDFWSMNDTTAQFSMHLGQTAVAVGHDYVHKNFASIISVNVLKHHFNVSNSYVMYKLRLLIFPWHHKPWTQKVRRTEAGHTEWQPPCDDINSTDLYIPHAATRTLVIILIDFLFVQCGCYLLNVQGTGQVVDLIAYGKYKFHTLIFVYAFAANTLFILCSLRLVVLPDSPVNVGTVNLTSRKHCITFLFLRVVLQVIYMGILVRL
ncbi:YIF1-domain-containing protein [Suillus subalutaceus]|uniref:YIF1-domain-containing protein n=1 Tax=Suillus subalutaceus TaxID=48586 RepID=UPI001B87DE4B|nr:YIF1-domain-containing protein [Suillus subalutaceus]KAG1838736.1 YIF1-domain-containing protein [Suillus subalutaceus]